MATLEIVFKGQNQVSGAVNDIKVELIQLGEVADQSSENVGGLFDGIKNLGTGVAATGIAAISGGFLAAAKSGLDFNNSMEQVSAQLNAFTKDGNVSAEILEMIRDRASKTPFEFEEMARAASGLIPAAKSAGVELESLIEQAEILAASNPAEGLEGAAFALREATGGDFQSAIERFNLSRQYINQLKEEGVPNLEIISMAMQQMGYDTELVTNLAGTADGKWSTLMDTFKGLAATVTTPIFDAWTNSLSQLNQWFTDNQGTVNAWAQEMAGNVKGVVDWFANTGFPAMKAAADEVIPVMGGLVAAYASYVAIQQAQAIPATLEAIKTTKILGESILTASLALAVIGVAVYGVIKAYQSLNDQIDSQTEQSLELNEAWRDSAKVLEIYNGASGATKVALSEESKALEEHRKQLEADTKEFAFWIAVQSLIPGQQEAANQRLQEFIATQREELDQLDQEAAALEMQIALKETVAAASEAAKVAKQEETAADEELTKALQKNVEQGQEAYEKLNQITEDYRNEQQDRTDQLSREVLDITEKRDSDLEQLETESAQKRTEIQNKYVEDVAKTNERFQSQSEEAQRSYNKAIEDAEFSHTEKLADINNQRISAQQDYGDTVREKEQALSSERISIEQNLASTILELNQKFNDDRNAANERYYESVDKINEAIAEKEEQYRTSRETDEKDFQDKMSDMYEDYYASLEDKRISFEQAREDRTSSHNDKITSIEEKLNDNLEEINKSRDEIEGSIGGVNEKEQARLEKLEKQRQALQDQIAAERATFEEKERIEMERFQLEAQRAQEAYDRKVERANRDQQDDRDRAAAKLESEMREAEESRAAAETAWQARKADLQTHLDEEIGARTLAAQSKEAQALAEFDLEKSRAQEALNDRITKLGQAEEAENQSYARRKGKIDEEFIYNQTKRTEQLNADLGALDTRSQLEIDKINSNILTQRAAILTGYSTRFQDMLDEFNRERDTARVKYDEQISVQQGAINQLKAEYATFLFEKKRITESDYEAINKTIRDKLWQQGVDARKEYGQSLYDIDRFVSDANHKFSQLSGPTGSPVRGYAQGGNTPANEPFLVGEDGPELLWLNRPAYVTSNADSMSMLGLEGRSPLSAGMGSEGASDSSGMVVQALNELSQRFERGIERMITAMMDSMSRSGGDVHINGASFDQRELERYVREIMYERGSRADTIARARSAAR